MRSPEPVRARQWRMFPRFPLVEQWRTWRCTWIRSKQAPLAHHRHTDTIVVAGCTSVVAGCTSSHHLHLHLHTRVRTWTGLTAERSAKLFMPLAWDQPLSWCFFSLRSLAKFMEVCTTFRLKAARGREGGRRRRSRRCATLPLHQAQQCAVLDDT